MFFVIFSVHKNFVLLNLFYCWQYEQFFLFFSLTKCHRSSIYVSAALFIYIMHAKLSFINVFLASTAANSATKKEINIKKEQSLPYLLSHAQFTNKNNYLLSLLITSTGELSSPVTPSKLESTSHTHFFFQLITYIPFTCNHSKDISWWDMTRDGVHAFLKNKINEMTLCNVIW